MENQEHIKTFLIFDKIKNECRIVTEKSSLVLNKSNFDNSIYTSDLIVKIELPEFIDNILKNRAVYGGRNYNVFEENIFYSKIFDYIEKESRGKYYVYNIFLSIILNLLGYRQVVRRSLKYVSKSVINRHPEFSSFILNLRNAIPINLKSGYTRKILIIACFGDSDKEYLNSFIKVKDLINTSTEIYINYLQCENSISSELENICYSNYECIIFLGHGTENKGIELKFTKTSVFIDNDYIKKIKPKINNTTFILFLCCNGEYYKKCKSLNKLTYGYAEGLITFEHTELFIAVFLKMLIYNVKFKAAFEWAKFSLLLKFPSNSEFGTND